MFVQLCILFIFLGLGEFIVWSTGIPIPSSIIGMILLFLALYFKVVRLNMVDKVCDLLVTNLGFFFIPAGIGVMNCFGLIAAEWLPIVMAVVVSSILIVITTGNLFRLFGSKQSRLFPR